MVFNSLIFLVFGCVFFTLWPFIAPYRQARWFFLTSSSFFFYGWWDWRFLFLLVGTGLIDFFAALAIEKFPTHKKFFLELSIISNLGVLVVFKYLGWISSMVNGWLNLAGYDCHFYWNDIPFPIGISFYTFQSLSYTIDVYRGNLKATKHPLHFFSFVAVFPHLVAGPINRATDLLPQMNEWTPPPEEKKWEGLKLMARGFFKKMVIADNLAAAVNLAFHRDSVFHSLPYWWIVTTMFAVQIYCDFSGYTDIARGLGKWIGYEFMVNFKQPYFATSMKDFWMRWHISLSSWFKDYLYIPLGGSRLGNFRAHVNMWITMVLSGLWHGASWNFLIWGALHAFYVSVERITRWPEKAWLVLRAKFILTTCVLIQVWVGWVFFRAKSLPQSLEILKIMFNPFFLNIKGIQSLGYFPIAALMLSLVLYALDSSDWKEKFGQVALVQKLEPILVSLIFVACVFLRGPISAFIYFQF